LLSGRYQEADDNDQRPSALRDTQPRRGLLSGRYHEASDADDVAEERPPTPRPTQRDTPQRRGLLSGRFHEVLDDIPDDASDANDAPPPAQRDAPPPRARAGLGGLLSRYAPPVETSAEAPRGWRQLTGDVRRLGQHLLRRAAGQPEPEQRQPRARDWRATDFATGDLAHWDQHGEAPFELPPDPDAPATSARLGAYDNAPSQDSGDSRELYDREDSGDLHDLYDSRADTGDFRDNDDRRPETSDDFRDDYDDSRADSGDLRDDYDDATGNYRDIYTNHDDATGNYRDIYDRDDTTGNYRDVDTDRDAYARGSSGGYRDGYEPRHDRRRGRGGAAWNGGGEDTGSWSSAAPAYDDDAYEPEPPRERRRPPRAEPHTPAQRNLVGDLRSALDNTALSHALNTIAQLGSANESFSRVDRLRLLMQRRPMAAGLLALFLISFLLTCAIPLITLTRLGSEATDLSRRMAHLQELTAGGAGQLIFGGQLSAAQVDAAALQSDLYDLNGVVSVLGWPLGAVSAGARDEQLLFHVGYDLAVAANEGMQVAQSVLVPLESGMLAATSTTPAITATDIQQARVLLADADAHTLDALLTYRQLDQHSLPAQFQPGGQYGPLLTQLPATQKLLGELRNLVDVAPTLLGVSQPAYYLIIATNNAQLRPGGGVQSSYGVLQLTGGKQPQATPFSLSDTYQLDSHYAQTSGASTTGCAYAVTEPPASAWWWPQRCVKTYGWGLRDANLSPDFPTNAREAMRIAQAAGAIPSKATFQGVIAFTPDLLARLLAATGPMPMPGYNVTVTEGNLAHELRALQSSTPVVAGQDHEQFTHELVADLLARIQTMQGPALSTVFSALGQAIQSKDLQIYLTDSHAEATLWQMGGASTVSANGDGFFVVDTNDGGNDANLYVSETQTDVVTLLPDGSALHRLAISVTYDKKGNVTLPGASLSEYSDIQRVYLPGGATSVGWAGYTPASLSPDACAATGRQYAAIVTDCSQAHGIYGVTTYSDTPGRAMVMGSVLALCGATTQGDWSAFSPAADAAACAAHPQPHTQTIFISWSTPNAYTVNADGHGTYRELVEKQPGDTPHLTVYITQGTVSGPQLVTSQAAFANLTANARKVFDGTLTRNQSIAYTF